MLKNRFIVVVLLCLLPATAYTDHLIDTRYCGAPERNADGSIKRNSYVVEKFKKLYPLPEGYDEREWQVDHTIPLANGGCDAVRNMQWLKKSIKTCPGTECKDRWEREVYPVIY